MVVNWLRDIVDHKWLALRALIFGWTAFWILWLVAIPLLSLDDWLFVRGIADIRSLWPDPRHPFFHFLIGGSLNAATGWIVGHFHREHRIPFVLLFFASLLTILDLPRFIPAAIDALGPGHEQFWGIVTVDFVFLRLPILAAGLWGCASSVAA
jgi:hypothetical protein